MNVCFLGFVALCSRLALGATPPPDHPQPVSYDIDRDGVQDVIQPSPQYNDMIPLSGRVYVTSGADHDSLFDVWSQQNNDLFGMAASSAGDLNGDGHAEVLVGAPWASMNEDDRDGDDTQRGRVDIIDGARGVRLATITGWPGCRHLGRSVAGLGDVDGDGVGDIAIGHRQRLDDGGPRMVGAVSILSGRTGALLSRMVSDQPEDGFGASIGGVGDVTGDTHADILISAPWRRDHGAAGDSPGVVYLFQGISDGQTRGPRDAILDIANEGFDQPGTQTHIYARQIAPSFDLDGDGRRDLLVVSVGLDARGQQQYDARVHRSVDGTTLRTITMDRLRLDADLNFDHVVDHGDEAIVHANLGAVHFDSDVRVRADIDRDGVVGLADLSMVIDALGQRSPLDGVVMQPLLDPQDDPWVEPGAPGFEVDPFDPCFGPLGDCDRDGIPNVNDPDSDWYDPRHPCSWILADCDGDDVPNWLDDDWWFYFFREHDPDACADALKNGFEFPGDVPWDHIPGENNPLHPCYDKRHPLSDPDRDGQPNSGDHDDDGDGIPDEIDDDPYCPCDTGACGACDYPTPPPGDDAPPPFDDDDNGGGGGGGGGGGDECDVDIHLTYSFAALPSYIDVDAPDLWIFARGGDTDFDWSWTVAGPGTLVVDQKDPRYACLNPTGMGTITVTAQRGCSASWDLHTVETDLALSASTLSHPDTGESIYLLPVNTDDDDADGLFDWDITDSSINNEDDGRDATLAPLDGQPLTFDESAWTMWHDGTVRVWYPLSGGDLREFAFNGPWDDPLDRQINGAPYRALPAGEYIVGLPVNERTLLVEALLPTFEYGDSHMGYTIWSTYQQDHDDNPKTGDVVRAMTINRPVFASLMNIDIDLDSDNNQGFEMPDRSAAEEWQEAIVGDPERPGKTIVANTIDADRDGVTDYADGYDRLPDPFFEDDLSDRTRFVPIVIEASGIRLEDTSLVIDYDESDPLGVRTNGIDLYDLPAGSMRLWRDDGDARRDGRSIDDGGSYIPPGIHPLANLMDGTGSLSVTLYVEVVSPSVTPGDLPMSITLFTHNRALPEFADTAHVNGVVIELQAMNFDSTEWQYAEGVVGTTTSDEPNDGFLSEAAWQIYTLLIHDARGSFLTEITIDGQPLPVYFNGEILVTPPFVCDAGDLLGPSPVPDVIMLNSDAMIEVAYNPMWILPSATGIITPPKHEKQLAELLVSVPEEMLQEGWVPVNPDDSGAYGKEVHRRISASLADDARWMTDVFVDSNTNAILSVGHVPPGGRAGTTEIDVLRLKRGYRPKVGDTLNPSRIQGLYEIKTSVAGAVLPEQLARLKRVIGGGDVKLAVTETRWIPDEGWQRVRRTQNLIRVLGIAGVAAVTYAYLVPDTAMAAYENVAEEYEDLAFARNRTSPDELEITLEAAEVVAASRAYLSRYVEDPAIVDLITQLAIYKAMDGDK